jgi:hypothetical protein
MVFLDNSFNNERSNVFNETRIRPQDSKTSTLSFKRQLNINTMEEEGENS